MTPYQQLLDEWKECDRCELCARRTRVVMARGKIPCDIAFVGEAPGESEDMLGSPFKGPAGHLLDQIVSRSVPEGVRCLFTNLVGCIPRNEEGGKTGEPPDESVRACAPRLQTLIRLAEPRLIVCVGTCARDWLDPKYRDCVKFHRPIPRIDVHHPAYILRANVVQRSLLVQRCVVTIANACEQERVTSNGGLQNEPA